MGNNLGEPKSWISLLLWESSQAKAQEAGTGVEPRGDRADREDHSGESTRPSSPSPY